MHRARRERSASSNTVTLFTESELYNGRHPSDRPSIAFEKIFHSVRPSRNFASSKQRPREIFFFFKESSFVSVSATRSKPRPKREGSKLFSPLLEILATPDGESFTVISVPKSLLCCPSHSSSIHVAPHSFSLAPHRAGRPAASSAGIKSRAVIMNDSRGERGYNCDWWKRREEQGVTSF